MARQPFTLDGVNLKQQELYSLSDTDLLAQAKVIYADIAGWLSSHFILSARQQAYIAGAPELVRLNWGAAITVAVSARRPIAMKTPPAYGPPRRTKQIIIIFIGDLKYYPPVSGPGKLEGVLEINIGWELVD